MIKNIFKKEVRLLLLAIILFILSIVEIQSIFNFNINVTALSQGKTPLFNMILSLFITSLSLYIVIQIVRRFVYKGG